MTQMSAAGNEAGCLLSMMKGGETLVKPFNDSRYGSDTIYASRLTAAQMQFLSARYGQKQFSPFEQMCVYVIEKALEQTDIDPAGDDVTLIISTTKGNIEWLGLQEDARTMLAESGKRIADFFRLKQEPTIISNACISGSLALAHAQRVVQRGVAKHAIVVGCDRFSGFVYSGFRSFHALADGVCRPFDAQRTGINLGEAAACIILSGDMSVSHEQPVGILAGAGISNDANHLSGPSRSGEELAYAIKKAMAEAGISAGDIGMVSAHGTATAFNDEMESKAIGLAGLAAAPIHSLKSYVGHTLGAAGILESMAALLAMQHDIIPASLNFESVGTPISLNVSVDTVEKEYRYFLKTASGFGGCNAALVWKGK
ncbi:MAG: beta-ketoacyl synthase N-terminal-like domain-containing protein [Edaphocola sp.]